MHLSLSPANLKGTDTASIARVFRTLNGVKSFDEMVAVHLWRCPAKRM